MGANTRTILATLLVAGLLVVAGCAGPSGDGEANDTSNDTGVDEETAEEMENESEVGENDTMGNDSMNESENDTMGNDSMNDSNVTLNETNESEA